MGTCHGLGSMPCGSGTILEYQTAIDPLSPGVPTVVAFPCSDAASGLSQLHPLQLHSPQPGLLVILFSLEKHTEKELLDGMEVLNLELFEESQTSS